jgi:hypothetical protein
VWRRASYPWPLETSEANRAAIHFSRVSMLLKLEELFLNPGPCSLTISTSLVSVWLDVIQTAMVQFNKVC